MYLAQAESDGAGKRCSGQRIYVSRSVPGSIRDIREFKKPRRMLKRKHHIRADFKWLSKGITWLRLLRLMIGLKHSR